MESEIIIKSILNKIITLAFRQGVSLKLDEKINELVYTFFTENDTKPFIQSQFICYTEDDSEGIPKEYLSNMFYDSPVPDKFNTWNEIPEPKTAQVDRDTSALINFTLRKSEDNLKFYENRKSKGTFNEIKEGALVNRSINYYPGKYKIKREIKKEEEQDEIKHPRITTMGAITMTNFEEEFHNDNTPEINLLRKEYEENKIKITKEKQKIAEEKRIEVEEQKKSRTIKKEFDSKRYTIDSKGNIIQFKLIGLQNFEKEFLSSSNKVVTKNKKQVTIAGPKQVKKSSSKTEENVIFNPYKDLFEEKKTKNKEPIEPSGSSFGMILPEIGVKITEGKLNKGGNKDFTKKFNKISLNEFNKYLEDYLPKINREKILANKSYDNIPKENIGLLKDISMLSSENNIDNNNVNKSTIMGSVNLMKSSNNPLIENVITEEERNLDNSQIRNSFDLRNENSMILGNSSSIYGLKYTLDTINDLSLDEGIDENINLKLTTGKKIFKKKHFHLNTTANEIDTKKQDTFTKEIVKDKDWGKGITHTEPVIDSGILIKKSKGNILAELGKSIVETKLPRSRKFNHNI
ncbi:MAG: hypothetical protein MJ252_03415 [archaeon]|nr:hypothetical protein [archaeon]